MTLFPRNCSSLMRNKFIYDNTIISLHKKNIWENSCISEYFIELFGLNLWWSLNWLFTTACWNKVAIFLKEKRIRKRLWDNWEREKLSEKRKLRKKEKTKRNLNEFKFNQIFSTKILVQTHKIRCSIKIPITTKQLQK